MSIPEYDKAIEALKAEKAEAIKTLQSEKDKIIRLSGATMRFKLPGKYYVYAAIFVLVLGLSYCGVKVIQRDAKHLAIAEEQEKVAKVDDQEVAKLKTQVNAEIVSNATLRSELAKASAKRDTVKADRDVVANKAIGAVMAPKSIKEVTADVKDILKVEPSVGGVDTLSFTLQSVQSWVAMKLDLDRVTANLSDTVEQLSLEKQNTALLNKDLDYTKQLLSKTEEQVVAWHGVADSYKVAAKKSGFQKFLSFGKTIGQIGLTALIVGLVTK